MEAVDDQTIRAAMENPNLYQGDIVMDDWNRFAHSSDYLLWPQKTIPYTIDSALSHQTYNIESAMRHISEKTCVKFKRRTYEQHYVNFILGQGCYSYIGKINQGPQPISLGYGCHYFGTIVHEIMHAIGFFHGHMRNDRDQFLNIFWHNIPYNFQSQFRKLNAYEGRIYTPFDYDSIMLYGARAFSRDGRSVTMSPKKQGIVLRDAHEKKYLSNYDAQSINKLYNC